MNFLSCCSQFLPKYLYFAAFSASSFLLEGYLQLNITFDICRMSTPFVQPKAGRLVPCKHALIIPKYNALHSQHL